MSHGDCIRCNLSENGARYPQSNEKVAGKALFQTAAGHYYRRYVQSVRLRGLPVQAAQMERYTRHPEPLDLQGLRGVDAQGAVLGRAARARAWARAGD